MKTRIAIVTRTSICMLTFLAVINLSACNSENPVTPNPPSPDFVATPVQGNAPLSVAFENLSSNFGSCMWDFGDGSSESTERSPVHVYRKSGNFSVKLQVTGPGGTKQIIQRDYIRVEGPSELVQIDPSNTPSCYPDLRAGDCDFQGHGPRVTVTADLEIRNSGQELWLFMTMVAVGTDGDDTEGFGEMEYRLFEAPVGKTINEVVTASHVEISFTDDDVFADRFETDMGNITIEGDTILGDLCGLEIGRTRADISLHTIWVKFD